MSGDGQAEGYNEPEAMRQFALSLGVPDEAISLDFAGRRTYDTCYRAKEVFGVKNALLVTQGFHLPGLYSCVMPWGWTHPVWRRTTTASGAVPC